MRNVGFSKGFTISVALFVSFICSSFFVFFLLKEKSSSKLVIERAGVTGQRMAGEGRVQELSIKDALVLAQQEFENNPERLNLARISSPDELLSEIGRLEAEYGRGAKLDSYVGSLFQYCSLSVGELCSLIAGFEDNSLRLNALSGISHRFGSRADSLAEICDIQSFLASSSGKEIMANSLNIFINAASEAQVASRMDEVRSAVQNSNLSDEEISTLLVEIAGFSSTERVAAFIDSFILNSSFEIVKNPKLQQSIFASFRSEAAVHALKEIGTLESYDPQAVWALAREALKYSPAEISYLTSSTNEGVRAAIIENFLQNSDLNSAKLEFESAGFLDKEIYKKVQWHLWDAQQRAVRQEMKENPLGTVNGLSNGTSKYDQNFLETAVTQWIAKDPDQAADWAEANVSQMAAGPRQFVAASYAKEAAAQGDLKLAREWAGLIQDKETLSRINGIIAGAEQATSN